MTLMRRCRRLRRSSRRRRSKVRRCRGRQGIGSRALVAPPKENLRKYGFQTASMIENAKQKALPPVPRGPSAGPAAPSLVKARPEMQAKPYYRNQPPFAHSATGQAIYRDPGRASAQTSQADLTWMRLQKAIGPKVIAQAANPRVAALSTVGDIATLGLPQLVGAVRSQNWKSAAAQAALFASPGKLGELLRAPEEIGAAIRAARAAGGIEGRGVITAAVRAAAKTAQRSNVELPERAALMNEIHDTLPPADAKYVNAHIDAVVHEHTKGLRGAARRQAAGDIYRQIHTNSLGPQDPFHVFPPEETATHLKSKLNPSNADKGMPLSPTRYGTVNGVKGIVVSGKPTVQEWVKRVTAAIPDAAERLKWKNWYKEVWPSLQEHFGQDAIWILRGFGASQANASPAMGLTAVLRMMDDLKRGIPLGRDEAMRYSAVAHSIMDAVRGTPVEEGVAKKLSDFIDSVQGRTTRTIMGHDPTGGMPAAVDIHTGRDFGLVDNKLVNRLQTLHGLTPGKDFTVDMGDGVPGTLQYERAAEFQHQIADHLNSLDNGKGFDGRNDWTPAEVQALGWGAIQIAHGSAPENMAFALNRNTSQIAIEVLNGTRGLGSGLPFAIQQAVTKDVAEAILPRLFAEENVYVQKIEFGAGGWQNEQSPNLVAHIIATPEQVDRIVSRAAQIFDRHDVWGVRVGVQVTKRDLKEWTNQIGRPARALQIVHGDFSNPTKLRDFWNNFRKHLPANQRKNFEGYTTYTAPDGRTGIRIITPIGGASEKSLETWSKKFEGAIAAATRDGGLEGKAGYTTTNVEVRNAENAVERAAPRRVADVRRPPSGTGVRAAVGDPLAAEARRLTEESIARNAALGPEARPGLGGVRPAPETGTGAGGLPPEQSLGGQMALPGLESQVPPEDAITTMAQRLHGAEMHQRAQVAGYTPERAKRFAAYDEAYLRAGGGRAGYIAASEMLRGQYPKLDYKGFSDFSPDAVDELLREIHASPELSTPERKRASKAIIDAVESHTTPQRAQLILLRKVFPEQVVSAVVKAGQGNRALNALWKSVTCRVRWSRRSTFRLCFVRDSSLERGTRSSPRGT